MTYDGSMGLAESNNKYLTDKLRPIVGPIVKEQFARFEKELGRQPTSEEAMQLVLGLAIGFGRQIGAYTKPVEDVYLERYGRQ